MSKLRELTLISLLIVAVVAGCSSSDQTVSDQDAVAKVVSATLASTPEPTSTPEPLPTATPAPKPTVSAVPTTVVTPTSIADSSKDTAEASQSSSPAETVNEFSVAELVARARESIVRIDAVTAYGEISGTGFAYTDELILTNAHVVGDAKSVKVSRRISEGASPEYFDAIVAGADELNDLAVLRVMNGGLKKMVLGNSANVKVGQEVVAIGFPLGIEGDMSVTRGIVSRKIDSDGLALIQHDAKILPGNSGGPLVTLDGVVVGINTAVVGDVTNTTGETLNFAIAAEEASLRLASLEQGEVEMVEDRKYVSNKYGHSFDIPDGWFLVEDSDEFVYISEPLSGAIFAIDIDSDLSEFGSADVWAWFYYTAGIMAAGLSTYELLDEEIANLPDGSIEWRFIEQYERSGDGFLTLGVQNFVYNNGLGWRLYLEAPDDVFDLVYPEIDAILASLVNPTYRPSNLPTPTYGDCKSLDDDYSGSITNNTVGVSSEVWFTLVQFNCDLVGGFMITSGDLVGSGPLLGYIDGQKLTMTVPGLTNDAEVDINFEGQFSDWPSPGNLLSELSGNYIVEGPESRFVDTTQKGIWAVTPDDTGNQFLDVWRSTR